MEALFSYVILFIFGFVSGALFLVVLDQNNIPWWEITDVMRFRASFLGP